MSTTSVENSLIPREQRTGLTPVVLKAGTSHKANGNGSSSGTALPNNVASRVQAAKERLTQTTESAGLKNGSETIEIKSVNVGDTLEALGTDGEASSKYLIKRELGEGGMGQVFLADELGEKAGEVKRVVAVKTLHPGKHKTIDVKRLLREAEAQRRITHPNVVSVLDFGEDNGRPFIVMEYVEGATLKSVLREIHSEGERGNLPLQLQLMLGIIISVLEGLQVAHQNGVVHRDIKPENIFIDKFGIPKLADFGLAKHLNATTITDQGVITGTLPYTAPERCNGSSGDLRSDIYSVGVMLYEMLTGIRPFEGSKPVEIIGKHLNYTPSSPSVRNSAIPKLLGTIVMQCLAKNPQDRFSSAKELADNLRLITNPTIHHSSITEPANNSSQVTSFSAV